MSALLLQYLRTRLKRMLDAGDFEGAAPLIRVLFSLPFGEGEAAAFRQRTTAGRERPLDVLADQAKASRGGAPAHFDMAGATAWLREQVATEPAFAEIVTTDPETMVSLCRAIDIARAVRQQRTVRPAELPLPVLITGETGTGKELLARAMHEVVMSSATDCADGAGYVAINCAGLPETLIESELFGYAAGSFTGAKAKGSPGLLQQYGRGTVLMDEIGDAPGGVQVKLLRFLNDGEVRPVGAHVTTKVAPWVLAATHRDLRTAIDKDKFRADLYERLTGTTIALRPLRARGDDARLVLVARLRHHAGDASLEVEFGPHVEEALSLFPWPGNHRTVNQVSQRIVLDRELYGRRQVVLDLEDLPLDIQHNYLARTPTVVQFTSRYRDAARRLTGDELASFRTALRGEWLDCLDRGAEPASRAAYFVRRLVDTTFVRTLAGEQHDQLRTIIERVIDRITDEQLAQLDAALTAVDGVPGPVAPSGSELESAPPRWVTILTQLLEAACRTPAFVELGDTYTTWLATMSPTWRRALEPLLLILLEDVDEDSVAPGGATDVFESWEVLKADRGKLEQALARAGSAAALGRAVGKSERTVRDRAKALGIDVRNPVPDDVRKPSGTAPEEAPEAGPADGEEPGPDGSKS